VSKEREKLSRKLYQSSIKMKHPSMNLWVKFVGVFAFLSLVDGFGLVPAGITRRRSVISSSQIPTNPLQSSQKNKKRNYHFQVLHESKSIREKDVSGMQPCEEVKKINPFKAAITKAGIISYIISMCVALPLTLFPLQVFYRASLISRKKKEEYSLRTGQFCSRWLMRIFPFAKIKLFPIGKEQELEPTIWVCNHTSMLDVFVLLAVDKRLRGKNTRPIKILYWKDLEKNLVTKILFTMSGFISIEMEDNGNGNANVYKKSSFKTLLKEMKQAFNDGFDIGILPEGQLNPSPEDGLQPVFPGAYTLAKLSRRPIRMMGLHGLNRLWHGDESIGMTVTGRDVSVRAYPTARNFQSADEFVAAFRNIVGHFGAKGKDLPNWEKWLDGTEWSRVQAT